ncbi:MAG: hypothetical protein ACI9LV_000619 [Candidatus Nanohaloarchaea archaeon]|jgi:hypothetical protein
MKMTGLGAGVIGLSSVASAWSLIQPSSQGTSEIDADLVDGENADNLGPSSTQNFSPSKSGYISNIVSSSNSSGGSTSSKSGFWIANKASFSASNDGYNGTISSSFTVTFADGSTVNESFSLSNGESNSGEFSFGGTYPVIKVKVSAGNYSSASLDLHCRATPPHSHNI